MIRKEVERKTKKLGESVNTEYKSRIERFKEMVYRKRYEHINSNFRVVKAHGVPFLMGKVKKTTVALAPTFCLAENRFTNEVEVKFDLLEKDSLSKVKEALEELGIPEFYNIYDRRKTS